MTIKANALNEARNGKTPKIENQHSKAKKALMTGILVASSFAVAKAEGEFSVTTATAILTAGLVTVGLIAGGGSALKGGVAVFNKVIGYFKRSS